MLLFVSPINGLEVREEPSLGSLVLRIVPYGEFLSLFQRTNSRETINGINNYWYSTFVRVDGLINFV